MIHQTSPGIFVYFCSSRFVGEVVCTHTNTLSKCVLTYQRTSSLPLTTATSSKTITKSTTATAKRMSNLYLNNNNSNSIKNYNNNNGNSIKNEQPFSQQQQPQQQQQNCTNKFSLHTKTRISLVENSFSSFQNVIYENDFKKLNSNLIWLHFFVLLWKNCF